MSDREPRQAHRQMFFRREAERIFHDFLYPEADAALGPAPSQLRVQANVFEDEQRIVVEVELPGVGKDDVALYVLRDRLIIEGVKPEQRRGLPPAGQGGQRPSFLCAERHFGAFERQVALDAPVDTSRIDARLKDGLLVVSLPKIADRRGKKKRVAIIVEASSSAASGAAPVVEASSSAASGAAPVVEASSSAASGAAID